MALCHRELQLTQIHDFNQMTGLKTNKNSAVLYWFCFDVISVFQSETALVS